MEELLELLRGRRIVVLAGAGCSTESGIPDYRSPASAARRRAPVQYQEFMRSDAARARYWARSAVGWPRMSAARPNSAHLAFAHMEDSGVVAGIITQNVDGLHHAAGSTRVIELHGSLAWVVCTQCSERVTRRDFQNVLLNVNEEWARLISNEAASAPDGDADLTDSAAMDFHVPPCTECGGIMKPDVVFFGENVPRARVDHAWNMFAEGDVLLVAGSSLTVFSGRRFVLAAVEQEKPIVVLNQGPTKADEVAHIKIDARLGEVVPAIAAALN